jgi:Fe-S-cluster containining protein
MGGDVVVATDEAPPLKEHLVRISRTTMALRGNGSSCSLLVRGVCSKYNARPRGCRDYPWYNIGNVLYYDAGCPGIKFDRDERPDISAITDIEAYYQILHTPLRSAFIKLMTLW